MHNGEVAQPCSRAGDTTLLEEVVRALSCVLCEGVADGVSVVVVEVEQSRHGPNDVLQ